MRKNSSRVKLHVKLGDKVKIIAGDDKGKVGNVLKIIRKDSRVIVEGINICFKHKKPDRTKSKGEIINYEQPIHISNVKKTLANDKLTNEKAVT